MYDSRGIKLNQYHWSKLQKSLPGLVNSQNTFRFYCFAQDKKHHSPASSLTNCLVLLFNFCQVLCGQLLIYSPLTVSDIGWHLTLMINYVLRATVPKECGLQRAFSCQHVFFLLALSYILCLVLLKTLSKNNNSENEHECCECLHSHTMMIPFSMKMNKYTYLFYSKLNVKRLPLSEFFLIARI